MLRDGLRLRDLSWLDLLDLASWPRPGSALDRTLDPDWWVTPDVQLLRDISDSLQWLQWAKTEAATKGGLPPKRTALTRAEREASRETAADVMSADDMLARLGWPRPDEEVSDGR